MTRSPPLIGWLSSMPNIGRTLLGRVRIFGLPGCQVSDAGGITSLSRPDRQAFLQKYAVGAVPSYSVAGVAADESRPGANDRTITTALRPLWRRLRPYSLDQDSQVIADDAAVPGGTLLAIARADHWAIALPFAELTNPKERERALRFVDGTRTLARRCSKQSCER